MNDQNCPCGSKKLFSQCCQPLLDGEHLPATAEALMRSRYSAYATGRLDYIDQTYHSSQRATDSSETLEQSAARVTWLGLEIIATEKGQPQDNEGFVDFIARYEDNGSAHAMRERSRFVRENQRWVYLDGDVKPLPKRNAAKVGRNDPCLCGSGKKFKKCCGK